jgi:hypothetical protein
VSFPASRSGDLGGSTGGNRDLDQTPDRETGATGVTTEYQIKFHEYEFSTVADPAAFEAVFKISPSRATIADELQK